MSKRTQAEYSTGEVPASVWVVKPMHVEEVDDPRTISEKIGSGRAFLKVVAYPWGVEFDACSAEGGA